MLPLRNVLALGICAFTAVAGEYVQTRPCKDDTGADGAWRSLSASIEQHGNYDNKLSLELHRESDNEDCRDAGSNFSATLRLDMLGRQSIYHESGSTSCYSWTSTLGSTGQYTVYSMPVNLGYLPPLSTFGIQYRIEAHDGPNIGCVQAEITPAISTSTSATLAWLPRAMFTFALLVGLMRGFEGRSHTFPDQTAISLSLPGVGDLLGYLQFVFLSASLSLQYPGFLQPFASKLSVFSLFTNGPLTRGFVYQGVSDGIYSINGTYGGTSGLEHMHQIVGTPNTVGTTWVNMIIAVIVVSAAAAVFLEAVTIFDRYFGRHGSRVQSAYTWRLAPKLLGISRVVLSYFALPLSAISFYQLSTAQQLPVYHTAFATILILSCMLAFYWLFRQLPFGTAGGLIHDTPKWYRKQIGRLDRAQNQAADRLTITIIIVLTFVRGAAIGGLQVYGAAQLAILGASELCFLVAIRWLKVYPFLSVGTATPVLRLIVISLMFCFVPGLLDNSAKSAVGYTIISLHGSFLLLAFFIPTIYHCARISWKFLPWSQQNALSASDPEQVAGIGKTESHLALTPLHRRNDQSESSSDGLYSSPPGTSDSSDSSRRPQDSHLSGDRYFRQPRHSSIRDSRLHSRRDTSSSIGYVISPDLSEKAHVDVGTAHCTNPSSSGSEDAWDDTQSLHLGPRWNDFTYREGDAFYTAPHTPVSATCSAIEEVATSSEPSPTLSKNSSQRLLNGAFSTLKASIGSLSSNRSGSKAKAFEVVRPSRPALSTASEEAAQGF